MLKEFAAPEVPASDELKQKLKVQRLRLEGFQTRIKEAGLPVMVIVEGWGSSGKGTTIDRVIQNLDPRFFAVRNMSAANKQAKRYPFLHRFMMEIPEAGRFAFFDTYWMEEVCDQLIAGKLGDKAFDERVASINACERSLADNGYLIVKLFFHLGKKEQGKRIEQLLADKNKRWRVDDDDLRENKHYKEHLKAYDRFLEATNGERAPWHIIDAADRDWRELQVLAIVNDAIEDALDAGRLDTPVVDGGFKLKPIPKLADIPLEDKVIEKDEYEKRLEELQAELRDLQNKVFRKRTPVVIAYEGWDAAGKGGNIKRITAALDSRGYEGHPIASPEPHEKARHFLWRFWCRLPERGHIAIFDRSWYGRVMVERIEGFCSENDWQRAYREINEFEAELVDWGARVIKFWVQIDKDTQLARFEDRQNTPEKQWKITEEDWRNREKWDAYETAIDEMLAKTSTKAAPWHVLESVDKRYARIKALEIVIDALKG